MLKKISTFYFQSNINFLMKFTIRNCTRSISYWRKVNWCRFPHLWQVFRNGI